MGQFMYKSGRPCSLLMRSAEAQDVIRARLLGGQTCSSAPRVVAGAELAPSMADGTSSDNSVSCTADFCCFLAFFFWLLKQSTSSQAQHGTYAQQRSAEAHDVIRARLPRGQTCSSAPDVGPGAEPASTMGEDTWHKFSIVTEDAQSNNQMVLTVRRVLPNQQAPDPNYAVVSLESHRASDAAHWQKLKRKL
ncbi:MAG: hypothetical protein FRX49_03936 [Trebouxia sp. A1-2]|nr:MAG: hypothetical protein FRX49_03936 [Trebouxia sp. A1-2]